MTRAPIATIAELARFGLVGAGTTILYGALALALTAFGWRAGAASVFAYGVSTACSYAGHRLFTFGAGGGAQKLARFLVINGIGLGVALLAPQLFAAFGSDPRWGVVAACVGIPLSNYFALKRLVFAAPAGARA